ncbi:non-hydrolyzing UDP-N-acetylglucosamine 2-epimerase [Streptomyces morookaense]|uniref:UDP-N-acetylglucosamine 2-epimerase (Non-hydrolyzing) n=1 Tax=Streptomyces morookaense TaxID=1970 RepID=A0A7Y7EAM7_STRMO|nr:UDP-N-acetylglucosamine 2-epimerase (non-hydrolyzing) [Streptomyces morookaense]NVK81674.1 UDP-N-acetylglucosamine 2-epimerase (non-hydrolyzing) [Streptomyces morookaense]GHF42289.1 UDP-N-acetyl glucosamine 2-epimerase [Streptomyces morookaense]
MSLPRRSIAIVLGTRPELVKLTDLCRLLGPAAHLIHTGQHYDEALSGRFLTELGLPEPTFLTGVGGQPRAVQISAALGQLDELFTAEPPLAVVVQGDTNASLAGALAANAHGIPLLHVEAGLRSHDRNMPEEHNRVLIDRIADVLCAATEDNRANLLAEGIDDARIAVTGNTVVEAVHGQLPAAADRAALLAQHGLTADAYVLATVHRPENTDSAAALRAILTELGALATAERPVVLPLHPRTRARIEAAGLTDLLAPLTVSAPLGYSEFLALARHSALLVSDSGGIQEECTVLGRPLVVVRRSTERPEAMADFADLVEPGPAIGEAARRRLAEGPEGLQRLAALPSPFGDGTASERIVALLTTVTAPQQLAAAA